MNKIKITTFETKEVEFEFDYEIDLDSLTSYERKKLKRLIKAINLTSREQKWITKLLGKKGVYGYNGKWISEGNTYKIWSIVRSKYIKEEK